MAKAGKKIIYQNALHLSALLYNGNHTKQTQEERTMKTVTFNKLSLVEVPAERQEDEGCVAFQMIEYVIDYFGTKVEGRFDTKIGFDGVQRVCGGDGFFKDGEAVA